MNLVVLLSIATIWLKKIYSLPKLCFWFYFVTCHSKYFARIFYCIKYIFEKLILNFNITQLRLQILKRGYFSFFIIFFNCDGCRVGVVFLELLESESFFKCTEIAVGSRSRFFNVLESKNLKRWS